MALQWSMVIAFYLEVVGVHKGEARGLKSFRFNKVSKPEVIQYKNKVKHNITMLN